MVCIDVISYCRFIFLFHHTQRPKVESQNDLTYVEGIIKDYSFEYKSGEKSISRLFYIWIQGYDCKFQIIADYLPYFEKSKFENTREIGDSIRISIPNDPAVKFGLFDFAIAF